jgi:polyribonucleotide nucleotidyltransferase
LLQIPTHKVKLVVGPGGEKIKFIQRKSKCRIQVPQGSHSVVFARVHHLSQLSGAHLKQLKRWEAQPGRHPSSLANS